MTINILDSKIEISQWKSIIPLKMRGKPCTSDKPILIYRHLADLSFFFEKMANFGHWKNISVSVIEISHWKSIIPLKMRGKPYASDKPILIYRHLADLGFFLQKWLISGTWKIF